MDLNSIERLQEYSDLPTEKGLTRGDTDGTSSNLFQTLYTLLIGSAGEGERESEGKSSDGGEGDSNMDASSHPLMYSGEAPTASPSNTHSTHSVHTAPVSSNILHPYDDILGTTAHSAVAGKWPSEGCVEFKNITLQYNSNANPVLR